MGKCFLKISTLNLGTPLCYYLGLVSGHYTMFIVFVLEDPFGTSDILVRGSFN